MRKFEYVFGLLTKYKKEYGNLDIPVRCVFDGYSLGDCAQNIRVGKIKLTAEERNKFDEIGFIWRKRAPYIWRSVDQICDLLQEYYDEYGHCNVPLSYVTREGITLGERLNRIDEGLRIVSKEDKKRLDSYNYKVIKKKPSINVISFDEFYELMIQYKNEYGDCEVPKKYTTRDGIQLGLYLRRYIYYRKKFSQENIKKLESLGVDFTRKKGKYYTFDDVYDLLVKFKAEYGHCKIPLNYCTVNGVHLGWKVYDIKVGNRKITEEQRAKLDELGFDWDKSMVHKIKYSVDEIYDMLVEYKKNHGNCNLPENYHTKDGIALGAKVYYIKTGRRTISAKQREKFENLGLKFEKIYKNYEKMLKAFQ